MTRQKKGTDNRKTYVIRTLCVFGLVSLLIVLTKNGHIILIKLGF